MARLASRFVAHLFACPDQPAPAAGQLDPVRLDHFIAYALHHTRPPESVTFASLSLSQRLKARFPAAKGSSGTVFLFPPLCSPARSSATIRTQTSPGALSLKECSLCVRSITWSARCVRTSNGNSTSTSMYCKTSSKMYVHLRSLLIGFPLTYVHQILYFTMRSTLHAGGDTY